MESGKLGDWRIMAERRRLLNRVEDCWSTSGGWKTGWMIEDCSSVLLTVTRLSMVSSSSSSLSPKPGVSITVKLSPSL